MHVNHRRGEWFRKHCLKKTNKWESGSKGIKHEKQYQQRKFRQDCKRRCRLMVMVEDYDIVMRNQKYYHNPWDWG